MRNRVIEGGKVSIEPSSLTLSAGIQREHLVRESAERLEALDQLVVMHGREAAGVDDAPGQLCVPHLGGEGHAHGDVMLGAADKRDLIAWVDAARFDNAQVGAAIAAVGEGLEPAGLVHPAGEGGAGRARDRDFEDALPYLNLLVNEHIRPGNALGGEVFTEGAVPQNAIEFAFPIVKLLTGDGIHGLVGAAVVSVIPDGIPYYPGAIAVIGARDLQLDGGTRLLIDARVLVPPMWLRAADSDVRGDHLHAHPLCHTSRDYISRLWKRASAVTRS